MTRPQLPRGVPVPDWPPASPGPAGPEDRRGWNEDWQIGDLARCITGEWMVSGPFDPKKGDVLRVPPLGEGLDTTGTAFVSTLGFEGKPANFQWSAIAFRKLRPAIDPAEAEFTADLHQRLKNPVLADGGGA